MNAAMIRATLVALALSTVAPVRALGEEQGASPNQHPPELVALAKEFRAWRAGAPDAVPDYAQQIERQKRELPTFRQRLEAIDPRAWPVHARVDYLVLQIEMDAFEFNLRVIRLPSRNPNFYVTQSVNRVGRHIGGRFQMGPGVPVPYDAARAVAIIKGLTETPAIIDQAGRTLTEAVPEMADMTIERLETIRQNYGEFAKIVGPHLPEPYRGQIGPAADKAGAALEGYREWLRANRSKMTAPWAIGRPAFEWYVNRVFVFPYDGDALIAMAESERERSWAFLQFERQKNRRLPNNGGGARPPVQPDDTNAEYSELKDATDVLARLWAEEHDLFTRPDYIGPMRHEDGGVYIDPWGILGFPKKEIPPGHQTEFLVPPDHWWSKVYWEIGHRLDPATNHLHNDYPGHAFERVVSRATTCEFRRAGPNTRGDAWTTYIEEVQLQMDYPFVRGPRVREWMYGLNILRAERVYTAVKFGEGSMTPEELSKHMLATVPWMEPFVAKKHEVWRKFDGNPADTVKYQVGKFEIFKLMRTRMRQLQNQFDLQKFHDELFATGQIPVALAAWEVTGDDSEIKYLWKRIPIPLSGSSSEQPSSRRYKH